MTDNGLNPTERIAAHYRDNAAAYERARDVKVAAGYKQSDLMDRVEQVAAVDRNQVSPTMRLALGAYVDARAAAQRVAAAGGDAQ